MTKEEANNLNVGDVVIFCKEGNNVGFKLGTRIAFAGKDVFNGLYKYTEENKLVYWYVSPDQIEHIPTDYKRINHLAKRIIFWQDCMDHYMSRSRSWRKTANKSDIDLYKSVCESIEGRNLKLFKFCEERYHTSIKDLKTALK